jgi:hypothetical protein
MNINYMAVLLCTFLSMVLGYVWYGPLFGKKWMEIVGVTSDDMEKRKEMQKGVGKLYLVQFLLTLFQVFILSFFLNMFDKSLSLEHSFWYWAAFVMPTIAGSSMWNNDSSKVAWSRFLIQSGYQLILFIMFALVLSNWR